MVESFADRLMRAAQWYPQYDLFWVEDDWDRLAFLRSKDLMSSITAFRRLGLAAGIVRRDKLTAVLREGIVPTGMNELARVTPMEEVVASSEFEGGNWGIAYLEAREAWATTRGAGARIAVLDSGVDAAHETLVGRVSHMYYMVDPSGAAFAREGLAKDSGYHGTHVASIAAGDKINLSALGYVPCGVAPEATVVSVQVLNRDAGSIRQICGGLDAVVDLGNIDVVNLSFELSGRNAVLSQAIARVIEQGTVVVVSTGNSGPGIEASPGNYPRNMVLSVGALAQDGSVWPYSNGVVSVWPPTEFAGATVEVPGVVAPGVKILGAGAGGGFRVLSGTSQAAPHVAGSFALLKAAQKVGNHEDAVRLALSTAKDSGNLGWDVRFGAGIFSLLGCLALT